MDCMSYDLTLWKPAATINRAIVKEVLAPIDEDTAHSTMQRFDALGFVGDLQAEFGGERRWSDDAADPPFLFEIADFTGTPANWVMVNMGFGNVASVLPKLANVATNHGLVVYDWQTEVLHGGRKPWWKVW
jgi:hypothetical protein